MAGASRAGQANEAGSVHRRGVAAYLAANGLVSRGLPSTGHGVDGPFPVRLEFETDQLTDDLTCHLSDGSRIYVSAKRGCGNDRHLRDTVKQWIAQAAGMADGDQLALATAEPRGIVKDLGEALQRRRAGSSTYSAKEKEALEVLELLLEDEPESVQKIVLDAASVLKIDAAEAGHHDFDLAGALLEGTVVAAGFGARSIRALSLAMHTQAGKAFASGIDDWVGTLQEDGIEVYADGQGPAGAVARARLVALEEHRARLITLDGVVDLSLLADDLPPLVVEQLADGLCVSIPIEGERPSEQTLLILARRWTRMLLEGLPGVGKSTALRQLAARWARNNRAPVPVPVPLSSIARRCRHPSEVTLSMLCEVAAQDAPFAQRADLATALELRCREGRAVLLLDGLDECMDQKALITGGLRTLLESLPSETGVILATRSSGMPAAERLGLPTAQLTTPRSLDETLRRLMQHVAQVRIAGPERDAWVETRIEWLEKTRTAHSDLGSVPLLATLLALVAAESADQQLPNDRANLLMTAVRNSVRRWERNRPGAQEDPAVWPTDAQLLDGYAALGHLLAVSGEVSVKEASAIISAMLADRWGMAAGPAEELTDRILWFWDEHVGVFVATSSDTVVPRSRVFAEIAAAMWTRRLSDEQLASWVTQCLCDTDQRVALLLAAELEPRVMTLLLADDESATFKGRSLLAAQAAQSGALLSAEQLDVLLDRLVTATAQSLGGTCRSPESVAIEPGVDAAERARALKPDTASDLMTSFERRRRRRDGPGWECAHALALLRVPRQLRDRRRRLLEGLPLSEEQSTVAQALYALSDATADGRPLEGTETSLVWRLLDLPLPEKADSLRRESRNRVVLLPGRRLLTGHAEAAVAAARQLDVLSANAAQRIHDIAEHSDMDTYQKAIQTLAARGQHFAASGWKEVWGGVAKLAAAVNVEQEMPLLRAAAELSADAIKLSEGRSWRMPELCDLFAVLEADNVGIRSFLAATTTDTDEMRIGWMRAAAIAADLDLAAVAAQARLALTERDNDQARIRKLVMTAPSSGQPPTTEPGRLGTHEQEALVNALSAESDWIAHTAFDVLLGSRHGDLRNRLLEVTPTLSPPRRRLATLLACVAADDPVDTAAQLLNQADPATRVGAAHALSLLREPNEQAQSLLAQARVAEDLAIRLAVARQDQQSVAVEPPTSWSCHRCAKYNDLADADCQHCDHGTRPATD